MSFWVNFFTCIGFIALILVPSTIIGVLFSPRPNTKIATWYDGLNKPSFTPPNWIFSTVWSVLYILMGISAFLIYKTTSTALIASIIFGIQLVLNLMWTPTFFGERNLKFALLLIGWLLPFVFWMLFEFYKISLLAFILMLPYAAWCCFATALSYEFLRLNHQD